MMKFKNLVIPNKLVADSKTLCENYGKFIAEPFEPGYGHTIGNSIRRMLLSSMEGSAIVALKSKNVLHEYSSIQGVVEDVMQIVLKLKQVRFKNHSEDIQILRLFKKGAGFLTAGDIENNSNVEVLNKDLIIATLQSGAEFDMELYVAKGRGYVSGEEHDKSIFPVNAICIDSIFTPIVRVNYEIENARIGNITDYDRLIMEIWTDGSIKPEDALAYSAKIVKDSMNIFINFEDTYQVIKGYQEKQEEIDVIDEGVSDLVSLLEQPVDVIELSVRSANCLKSAKIRYIKELVIKKETDLLNYKNFGRKSLDEIKEKLTDLGFSLGMDISSIK